MKFASAITITLLSISFIILLSNPGAVQAVTYTPPTVTSLSATNDTADSSSYVSSSISPAGNTLLLVWVNSSIASGTAPLPTVSGLSLTWEQEQTITYSGTVRRLTLFSAISGPSPGSGALTITMTDAGSGTTSTGMNIVIMQVANYNVDTPIVQVGVPATDTSDTSGSITLASPLNIYSRPAAVFAHREEEVTTHRVNWAELSDVTSGSPVSAMESQWRSDSFETTASATWATSARWGGIAVELAAESVGENDTPNMISNSYMIQFGNFNVTSGEKESASYNVTDTVGQVGSGPYGQYGVSSYFVGGGFQYIYQIAKFSFRISKLGIELGTLTPGIHNTDSHNIAVTAVGASGYNVYAYEAHRLRHSDGTTFIPDTTCNAGTCTHTTAQLWTTLTVPGFGFNVQGNDIPADFVNGNYFRSFADNSLGETMQTVMSSPNIGRNRTAVVTYKAGVSGDQSAGNYSTNVIFVAVPGY